MKSRKVKGKRRQTERQKGEIINEKQLSYFSAGSFNNNNNNNNNKLDPSTQSSLFHVFVGFNVESKINRRESILSSRREGNDE